LFEEQLIILLTNMLPVSHQRKL